MYGLNKWLCLPLTDLKSIVHLYLQYLSKGIYGGSKLVSQYSSTSSLPLLVSYLSPRLDLTMARKDSSKHWDQDVRIPPPTLKYLGLNPGNRRWWAPVCLGAGLGLARNEHQRLFCWLQSHGAPEEGEAEGGLVKVKHHLIHPGQHLGQATER